LGLISFQAHAKLKSERDGFEMQVAAHDAAKAEWEDTREKLSGDLQAAVLAMDDFNARHSTLQTHHSTLQKDHSSLREQLADSHSQLTHLASLKTQVHNLQSELKRKGGAEETVKSLQGENVELMQSLNEVRDKVVQLSGEKMDLTERVEGAERALRSREDTIAQLELELQRAEAVKAETDALKGDHGKQVQRLETILVEHQQAYAALQGEMDEMSKGVQSLNGERTNLRHTIAQLELDLQTARGEATNLEAETQTLRLELNDRAKGGDEISGMLSTLREEVEGLRTELSLKNEELLRAEANARSPMPSGLENLSDEMHALELSAAQSQVRSLETTLFQEQAKTHTLQRRITGLEDEVHMMKMQTAHPQRLLSPRPPSVASVESKRAPQPPPAPKRPPIDSSLPADVMHKRKISLSMLKARIESELSVRVTSPNGHTPRMGMGQLVEEDEEDGHVHSHGKKGHRPQPQFGDELHVFCCASCQGDLVVL
jgi:chromosome segregation ATPase